MKVVLVIPTYNEKENIVNLITIIEEKIFPSIKSHSMQILVVDDSSPDGTGQEVKKLMKKWRNIFLLEGEKQGLGFAYLRGMSYAIEKMQADVLFEMDADLSHDPKHIPDFLKKIIAGSDIVIGSRYSQGGSIPANWGITRKAYSVLGNLVVRAILGRFYIHDWTGGYRALRKEVFLKEKNQLKNFKGYTFQVSFLHKAVVDGFSLAEVPIHFTDRSLGKSKIAASEYITNLLQYVVTARIKELRYSPFLKYAMTGFMGYLINATSLELFKSLFHFQAGTAAMLGAELSIIWNFILNNVWAFSRQSIGLSWKLILKFLQFNAVSIGSVAIVTIVVFFLTHLFGDTLVVRQLALIFAIGFLVIPYSYTMYNIFIWKRWHISYLAKLQKLIG